MARVEDGGAGSIWSRIRNRSSVGKGGLALS